MIPAERSRLAAALCCSVLVHALALALLRMPPAPPPYPAGSRLNLLLIPIPRWSPSGAEDLQPIPSPVKPQSSLGEQKRSVEKKPVTPQAAAPEVPARRRQPSVTAGPISAPAARPESRLADARAYLGAERLSAYPDFAAPFAAPYPRRALEEGRRAVVVVQLMIDEDGAVAEALTLPGAPEDFAEAALAALRRARFRPAEAGGRPVRARAYFAVSFVIE